MAGDHWAKREQCNFAAWIKPKAAHNRFVNEILQTKRAPDLCFCAREAEARQGQEQQDRASAAGLAADLHGRTDRKSVVWGTSVSVRVELGGRRIIKKKRT